MVVIMVMMLIFTTKHLRRNELTNKINPKPSLYSVTCTLSLVIYVTLYKTERSYVYFNISLTRRENTGTLRPSRCRSCARS